MPEFLRKISESMDLKRKSKKKNFKSVKKRSFTSFISSVLSIERKKKESEPGEQIPGEQIPEE